MSMTMTTNMSIVMVTTMMTMMMVIIVRDFGGDESFRQGSLKLCYRSLDKEPIMKIIASLQLFLLLLLLLTFASH